jgi:coproporphyrinogen III oxidase
MKYLLLATIAWFSLVSLPATAEDAPQPQVGNRLGELTPEQQDVAKQMVAFMTTTEDRFWKALNKLDPSLRADEALVFDDEKNASYEIRVQRGDLVEKAGVMTITTHVEEAPFIIGGRWNRFIEVAVHPKTPLVGMLHATFSVQVSEAGIGNIGATTDMMQSAQPPEDLELMRQRISDVFRKHGIEPDRYRPHGCGEPNAGFWKWHRAGTCTGVSLYGKQFTADQKTFDLVTDLYTTTIDTYMEILRRRAEQSYDQADIDKQNFMRRRWLEDQLFWDVLAKNFVVYEAWSAVNAPPVVRY